MRYLRFLLPILVGWYLVLALGHYFDQRPLWLDEKCVFNSIIGLKPTALFTQPLLSDQAFPRLYLWLIQLSSKPFDQNLLALRFFPCVAMIGAFFVWFNIARRVLSDPWDLVLFIGCWCASMPLVYHAAELKPYSMDVLASGLIVLFLLKGDSIYCPLLYLFLPLLGLWSYPAIFLLFLPLYNLVRDCFDKRRWTMELSLYLAGCILTVGLVYLFDLRTSVVHLMVGIWYDYFISMGSLKDFLNSFGKGMNNLISRGFAESPRWIKVPSRVFIGLGVGYMLLVFWGQFKKDLFWLRSIVPIASAIFLIQLVLAIWRIYPFAVPRLSLFFTPLLFLMTIMAINHICQQHKALGMVLRVIFAGYLIFVSFGIAWDVFKNKDLGALSTLYYHNH